MSNQPGTQQPHGGQAALLEALQLQQTARENAQSGNKRAGRRRKSQVIDLDRRIVVNNRRRHIFMTLLWLEGFMAALAISVLVAYLVIEGDSLR